MIATAQRQLAWFRTDLRTHDNTALAQACSAGPTVALFVLSPQQWLSHDDSANKVDFWLRNLRKLSKQLADLNIPLLIEHADTWDTVPGLIRRVCHAHDIHGVHCNREYGVNEGRRDAATAEALKGDGVQWHSWLDGTLFEPGAILTHSGGYFKVFSQFRKQCLSRLEHNLPSVHPRPAEQAPLHIASSEIPTTLNGFTSPSEGLRAHWPAGETEARKRLDHFIDADIDEYDTQRDLPARPGTSTLSPYLNAGVISIRQCLHAALRHNQGELYSGSSGVTTWVGELIWREFYRHILEGFPRVSMHKAFRPETEALPWRHSPDDLAAWQEGRTGIPLVDAAMKQLVETGWMHNRLRMVTAMFLTKNLLINWREGERFFMRHLIDGDLAANNGGWQWSASTGTDSVPYFRLFNPLSQSQRFDPQGVFLKQWLPQLEPLCAKSVHEPARANGGLFAQVDYPKPIVDLKSSRERALSAFRNL